MEIGAGEVIQRAHIEGSGKLKRDILVKVRLDAIEFQVLNAVMHQLKVSERALALRSLLKMFPELEKARRITLKYETMQAAKNDFEKEMMV